MKQILIAIFILSSLNSNVYANAEHRASKVVEFMTELHSKLPNDNYIEDLYLDVFSPDICSEDSADYAYATLNNEEMNELKKRAKYQLQIARDNEELYLNLGIDATKTRILSRGFLSGSVGIYFIAWLLQGIAPQMVGAKITTTAVTGTTASTSGLMQSLNEMAAVLSPTFVALGSIVPTIISAKAFKIARKSNEKLVRDYVKNVDADQVKTYIERMKKDLKSCDVAEIKESLKLAKVMIVQNADKTIMKKALHKTANVMTLGGFAETMTKKLYLISRIETMASEVSFKKLSETI